MQGPSSFITIPGINHILVPIADLAWLICYKTAFVVIVVVFVAFIVLFPFPSTPVWVSYVSSTSRFADFDLFIAL